ncbi:MAG: hypothetical protein R2774_07675 [Saprospiraceae bacterium]
MKNLVYLLLLSVFLYNSCSDQLQDISNDETNEITQSRSSQTPYVPISISSKTDAHKAIAYAVSILFETDPSFKTYVIDNMVREQLPRLSRGRNGISSSNGYGSGSDIPYVPSRLKDLLIYEIVKDPVKKVKINKILKTLPHFDAIVDPVEWVLAKDPIMAINMPMHTEDVCDYQILIKEDPDLHYPIIVEDFDEKIDYIFENGNLIKKVMDDYYACGIYISTAIYFVLADPDNYSICGGTNLKDVMGDDYLNCSSVANNIIELGIL